MNRLLCFTASIALATAAPMAAISAGPAVAATSPAGKLAQDSQAALYRLYASNPKARALGAKAEAILIFPKIYKAGFVVGAQSGDGTLFQGGKVLGYYRTSSGSFGLQAGAQSFSYVLFLITDSSMNYLKKSDGWSLGSGPSFVLVDKGVAATLNTTTLTQDVYAMTFGQTGLMGGIGLEGAKITRIHPNS